MIVGTFNIRGRGSLIKRKRIRSIINKGRANFFLIQESKMADVSVSVAKSFWGNEECGFSFSSSVGSGGGLLSLWNSKTVSILAIFKGEGYLGSKVYWKGGIYYILNVYSP